MLFVCGDIHSPIDIKKLSTKIWKEQKELNKNDILINLGDFGGFWYPENHSKYKKDLYWLKWLCKKSFTFTFLDGNHENHKMLNELSITEKWGGKVGYFEIDNNNKIYYLKRGEIYIINGFKILIIGGAESGDKDSRTIDKDWWEEELLSDKDKENVWNNLKKHNFKVDYILSHTCPKSFANEIYLSECGNNVYKFYNNEERFLKKLQDPTVSFLEEVFQKTTFKEWHFGHWHLDIKSNFYDFNTGKSNIFNCHYKNKPLKLKSN